MRDDGNDAGSGNRGLFALARPRPVETVRRRNDIDFGRSAGKHDQKVADHPDLAPDHGVSRHNEPRVGPERAKKGTTPERVVNLDHRIRGAGPGSLDGPSLCRALNRTARSEEHTSELQSLMRISYAVFCSKTKTEQNRNR